ncbi:MAG: MBL fold metallo-hydrolase [Pseudomonadota bacterium]
MTDPFNRDPSATYDRAERIAPLIRRLTVQNPSPMTFTGTQSYILGEDRVSVIDPGPVVPGQVDLILSSLEKGERVEAILITHTHVDHSPGAAALHEATGAPIYAYGGHGEGMSAMMTDLAASGADLGGGEGADRAFVHHETLRDGDRFEIGDLSVTALHTPGHLSNHLSFALDDGAVFTGDLVMGWATTMVSPPDGDMAAFMSSLDAMAAREDRVFHPGHGHAVEDPKGMIAYQTAHRKSREAQIADALASMGDATPMALTKAIYTDVDPRLHGAASRNVFAALLGMVAEGRAEADGRIAPDARFRLIR